MTVVNSSCAEVACSAPRTYTASNIFFALLRLAVLVVRSARHPRAHRHPPGKAHQRAAAVGLGCRPDGDHGSGVVYRPFYPAPDTVIAACSSASKA
jgi:hypothetical protein